MWLLLLCRDSNKNLGAIPVQLHLVVPKAGSVHTPVQRQVRAGNSIYLGLGFFCSSSATVELKNFIVPAP